MAGVKALAAGDFTYSITPRGSRELVELSTSFAQMRGQLLALQQQRIETERIAALARAASSISHDLRHYLAAVVANAEFLYEAEELRLNRDEVYEEIKTAATQMTDQSTPCVNFPTSAPQLSTLSRIDQVIRRAAEAINSKSEFRNAKSPSRRPEISKASLTLEKSNGIFNLILNACESTSDHQGSVLVDAVNIGTAFEIRVKDSGRGIPAGIVIRCSIHLSATANLMAPDWGWHCQQDYPGPLRQRDHRRIIETGTTVLVRLPLVEAVDLRRRQVNIGLTIAASPAANPRDAQFLSGPEMEFFTKFKAWNTLA